MDWSDTELYERPPVPDFILARFKVATTKPTGNGDNTSAEVATTKPSDDGDTTSAEVATPNTTVDEAYSFTGMNYSSIYTV